MDTDTNMVDWARQVLPFYSVEITLEVTRPTRLPACHRAALTDMVRSLIDRRGGAFPGHLLVEPAEDGKTLFRPGDAYRFGVTLFPNAMQRLSQLLQTLEYPPAAATSQTRHLRLSTHNLRLAALRDRLELNRFQGLGKWCSANT